MKPVATLAALASLAACAATPPPQASDPPVREPAGKCDREVARTFVGQKATAALGAEMLAATGARTLRWVPPRTAVTMDFRPDRLTVTYDDDMVITQASCT